MRTYKESRVNLYFTDYLEKLIIEVRHPKCACLPVFIGPNDSSGTSNLTGECAKVHSLCQRWHTSSHTREIAIVSGVGAGVLCQVRNLLVLDRISEATCQMSKSQDGAAQW